MPDLYLLHFDPPYRHARHYLGYAVGTGRGARYARAQANLVEIRVADVLVGEGRATQRRMRSNGSLSRFCPVCQQLGLAHR